VDFGGVEVRPRLYSWVAFWAIVLMLAAVFAAGVFVGALLR
jgi:hypothetical protein